MGGSEVDLIPSLRQGLQLLILSGLAALLVDRLFVHNAATSRVFAICCAILVLAFPLTWLLPTFVVPIPMTQTPSWLPDASVPGLVWVSLFGSGIVLATRTIFAVFRQQLRYARLTQSADRRLIDTLNALVERERGAAPPAVKLVAGAGPASGTLVADVILLPEHATTWSESTLQAVYNHELTHIRRRDDRWLLLMRVLTDLYWWLPWLKNLELRCRESIEESCDDIASQRHPQREEYLTGVLVVARDHLSLPGQSVLAGMVASGGGHLMRRVKRFGDFRFFDTEAGHVYWTCVGMLVIALVAAGVKPVVLAKSEREAASNTYTMRLSTPLPGQPSVELSVLPLSSSAILHARVAEADLFMVPLFPGLALNAGAEGEVVVRFDLAADGTVVRPVLTRSVVPELDGAAFRAVQRMRFPPIHAVNIPPVLDPSSVQRSPKDDRQLEARVNFRLNRVQ